MDSARSRIRRRESRDRSPMESSSDELAAGPEIDESKLRRGSWSNQKTFSPKRPKHEAKEYRESESSDELAGDAENYWRGSRNRRSRSPIDRHADSSSNDRSHGGSDEDRMSNGDETLAPERDDTSDRSPTPMPSVEAPLKPERLNYKEKFVLRGHLRGVSAVQFSPDCSMIASGSADATIKVWDTSTGRLIYTFEGHLAGISSLAWSPDGQWIASGSDDKTIRFWNVNTGRAHTKTFEGHHNYVYQIAFAPKGNILVSGSYDEAVFIWDVRRARVMRSLPAHSDPVAGIDVVHDGTLIVSCALDGLVRVWDTHSGQCLRTLVHEDNPPATCVKFSPNGKYILAWTLDGCVRMWNYVESRVIKTFQGHVNKKYSLSGGFGYYGSPDVKCNPPLAFAVSGSEDGAILCWDIVSKNILQRIEGHTDVVIGVHTGKLNGKRMLVSCGLDRTVRVWEEATEDQTHNGTDPSPIEVATETVVQNDIAINNDEDDDNEMADAPPDPSTETTPALTEDVTMT
ncbi:Protein will die slowly [Penicillium brasilianum]|uniref:Mitochondrial division protein 1 n=1 Tax=Penicillium brasilianum TaxID=104259 RepID=A0A1S9RFW8_PENBI|nr:Protein will die slowly [Penicillium brasilianum]